MASPEPSDPRIGSVVQDRYTVTDRLSSGGMGVVYRAERLGLGRVVAIKFLHAAYSGEADFVNRFEREARLMSRLEHPNIVKVIDFGVAGSPYIVMDFVSGATLADLLEDGAMDPARAVGIARQVLAGLAHAHDRGVVHRDIKPANIMLSEAEGAGDHVQLLDFGLAKLRDADQSMTSMVVGTPSYMSPEQAAGRSVDGRADLYATGVLLFELLVGDKPFRADEPMAVLQMHLHDPVPPLPGISAALAAAVDKAMAKDPADRFQRPGEMSEALAAALREPEVAAPALAAPAAPARSAPTRRTARPARPAPRRTGIVWLAALGLAAAGWWMAGKPGLEAVRGKVGAVAADRGAERADAAAIPLPETVAEAEAAVTAGDRETAIRGLHERLRAKPKDADAARLLGQLYFEKDWWTEGLAAYRKAIESRPALADDTAIHRDVVKALSRPETAERATFLVLERIGPAAIPALATAAKKANPKRRKALAALIRELRQ
jgi:serine/threonine-protein kinase